MDIILKVIHRKLVVYHLFDTLNVQPTRRHICRDHDAHRTRLKLSDGGFPLALGPITAQRVRFHPLSAAVRREFRHRGFHVRKDDDSLAGALSFSPKGGNEPYEDVPPRVSRCVDDVHPLRDAAARRELFAARPYSDFDRLRQEVCSHLLHGQGPGRRVEEGLPWPLGVGSPADGPNILLEAHVKHPVRFVEYQHAQRVATHHRIPPSPAHVQNVTDAPRGADDYFAATL
mmetsp:Transcript_39555/g.53748  ORF Transcript_39555/g.53748 Transcript_39555/m.53748 type:complete len:230 (+) Transcript_39555:377-1066(+)